MTLRYFAVVAVEDEVELGVLEPADEDPPPALPLLAVAVDDADDVDEADASLLDDVLVELLAALAPPFLFEPPEYRSEYQPPPLRMKFPELICRFASGLWQLSHSLIGSSVMRWTRSNSKPQASQR